MFRLGASTSIGAGVDRPLTDRVSCAGYAAMAYWYYRWDWGESVAIDGLVRAGRALGTSAFTRFALDETTAWADRADTDPHGPAGALLDLLSDGLISDPDAPMSRITGLIREQLTTGEAVGGWSPHGADDALFVDALYGHPAVAVRLGRLIGDDEIVDRAVDLTVRHCSCLQDAESGLFSHIGVPGSRLPPESVAWGRGNGWAVLGLSDLLLAVGPHSERTSEVRALLTAVLDGLRSVQAPSGLWRNILDEPSSYPESSTTALIEAGISAAMAQDMLDEAYRGPADAAWLAIADRIDTSGHLVGVSYRPGINADPRRYEHTPAVGAYPWGQGAYLRSACGRLEAAGTAPSVSPLPPTDRALPHYQPKDTR